MARHGYRLSNLKSGTNVIVGDSTVPVLNPDVQFPKKQQ